MNKLIQTILLIIVVLIPISILVFYWIRKRKSNKEKEKKKELDRLLESEEMDYINVYGDDDREVEYDRK